MAAMLKALILELEATEPEAFAIAYRFPQATITLMPTGRVHVRLPQVELVEVRELNGPPWSLLITPPGLRIQPAAGAPEEAAP
jgi:hypothetical protein